MKMMKIMALSLAIAVSAQAAVTLTAVPAYASTSSDDEKDYEFSDLSWDTSDGRMVATWEKSEDSQSYQVTLYRNGKSTSVSKTTSGSSVDFTSTVIEKGKGTYTFKVKGKKAGTTEESDEIDVDYEMLQDLKETVKSSTSSSSSSSSTSSSSGTSAGPGALAGSSSGSSTQSTSSAVSGIPASGRWVKDAVGWWYQLPNGSWHSNSWQLINNKWYYFAQDGYILYGWQQIDGKLYYLDPVNGDMKESTVVDGHQLGADGAAVN